MQDCHRKQRNLLRVEIDKYGLSPFKLFLPKSIKVQAATLWTPSQYVGNLPLPAFARELPRPFRLSLFELSQSLKRGQRHALNKIRAHGAARHLVHETGACLKFTRHIVGNARLRSFAFATTRLHVLPICARQAASSRASTSTIMAEDVCHHDFNATFSPRVL